MQPWNPELLAATLLRVGAVLMGALALWQLLVNAGDAFREVDPSYFGHFFQQNLLRPVVGLVLAAILFFAARPLGRLCALRSKTAG